MIQSHVSALSAVAERISAQKDALARRTVDRFREEIVGWRNVDESEVDVARAFTLRNIEALVDGLEHGNPVPEALLDWAREIAARRAHQGVSLEALLHQIRLWGELVWDGVLGAARLDRADEREAAIEIVTRLWRHVDVLSTTMAHAYLDEMTDRGLVGRELLDGLLNGEGDTERVRRLARILHRRLGDDYIVVLVRSDDAPLEDAQQVARATRVAVDQVVHAARTRLNPTAASLVVGVRQGDVVALYPTAEPEEIDTVRRECAELAADLPVDVSIGMSGWHRGRSAIATAYEEAREAAEIAAGTGIRGRAVVLGDVLVDHMLRASPHARRILRETLQPLVDYDRSHNAELVQTLRAYLDAGTKLTQSARILMVHANTVVYRLRRIRELTGRDPHTMEDLQILFLALKLNELNGDTWERS